MALGEAPVTKGGLPGEIFTGETPPPLPSPEPPGLTVPPAMGRWLPLLLRVGVVVRLGESEPGAATEPEGVTLVKF